MSTSVAKHFTDFASKRDFRLGERPSWTRSQQGQGATKVYAKMREASYRANAPLIRNRRLAQSIGYDPNYALNVKMNREISDRHFMDSMSANTTTATDKLKGLRSHITPVFTNTHGALSSFQAPGLVGSLQKGDGWNGSGTSSTSSAGLDRGRLSRLRGNKKQPSPPKTPSSLFSTPSAGGGSTNKKQPSPLLNTPTRRNFMQSIQRARDLNKRLNSLFTNTSESSSHHAAPTPTLQSNTFQSPAPNRQPRQPGQSPLQISRFSKRHPDNQKKR
jgi:hypothetical protein